MDEHLGDYESLDDERAEVIAFWAPLILAANESVARSRSRLLAEQQKYVLDRASWAVTEIKPSLSHKLLRQRFWSFGALHHAALFLPSTRPPIGDFRHEHVVPRRDLIQELVALSDVGEIANVLRTAVACVVTKDEARALDAHRTGGWSRYAHARVRVFDRSTGREHSTGSAIAVAPPRPTTNIGPASTPASSSVGPRPASIAAQTLEAMAALEALGGRAYFADLHHFATRGRRQSFVTHQRYCQERNVPDGPNGITMRRIRAAIESFRRTNSWPSAIAEAWRLHPHIG